MRRNLRSWCFLWLSGFVILCFILNFSVDQLYDFISSAPPFAAEGESEHSPAGEFLFILVGNLLCLPLFGLLAWMVARRIVQPIVEVATAARQIATGDTQARIPTTSPFAEVNGIAQTLNTAFDRYDHALQSAKRFNANAAHQLRAPLTAIRAVGEVCLHQPRSPEAYRETLATILERVGQMSGMVDRLLSLSELAARDAGHKLEPVDLMQVALGVCEIFRPLAEDAGVALRQVSGPAIWIRGDALLLDEMLANLVDNAIRAAGNGGAVSVYASEPASNLVTIAVADTGAGFGTADRARLFKRFVKGRNSVGTGLGLAIVSEIVDLHGGTVEVFDGDGQGTRIEISFPAIEAGPGG